MQNKLVVELASLVDARLRCMADVATYRDHCHTPTDADIADCGRKETWVGNHERRIKDLCREFLPSGSGFDKGTDLDLADSTADRLVFHTAFHHMDDNGFYDGWTDHTVLVTPSLIFGFTLYVKGKDKRQIKDHIHESLDHALNTLVGDP